MNAAEAFACSREKGENLMSILHAVIYGIIQGITEFLPVSSTAHLQITAWFTGWQDFAQDAAIHNTFDLALHLGTAFAVIGFFFKDWLKLISKGVTAPKSSDGKLFWILVISVIPAAVGGLLFSEYFDRFVTIPVIGVTLIVMGIVLYLADKYGKKTTDLHQINAKTGLLIGLSQLVAMIPGTSRSGITISTGRALGVKRESAARFTFLLAAPTILGDALYHLLKSYKDIISGNYIVPFLVGIATSAIVGALVIKFLLDLLKKHGFGGFAIYRAALGAAVLICSYFIR